MYPCICNIMNTFYYSLRYINNNENEKNNKEKLRNITFSVFSTLYTTCQRKIGGNNSRFIMQLEPFRMHFVLRLPFGRLVKISKTSQSDPKQFALSVYRLPLSDVHITITTFITKISISEIKRQGW